MSASAIIVLDSACMCVKVNEMESQPGEVCEEKAAVIHAERVEQCSDFNQINLEAM